MAIDLSEFAPIATTWLNMQPSYEGSGKATFKSPQGIIEGLVQARFDVLGHQQIEMDVLGKNIHSRRQLVFGLDEFLSGEKPKKRGKGFVMNMGLDYSNPCSRLTVATEHGKFRTDGKILCWPRGFAPPTAARKLAFHAIRSQFDAAKRGRAKYWVLPLVNYLGDFYQSHPDLDNHPLRIFKTPALRDGLSQEERILARIKASERNKLIIFRFKGRLGFIEQLPDYEERKAQLLSGKVQRIVTSVMIGEVGDSSIEFDDLDSWFPFDFLLLLGIASGSEVGAPWIEFRDAKGKLVRRAHISLGDPVFLRGHAAIPSIVPDATGLLLTQANQSGNWNSEMVRIAIKQILYAGLDGPPVEDCLSHAFRALDQICEGLGLKKAQLLTDALTPTTKNEVEKSLKNVKAELQKLAAEAKKAKNEPETRALDRIVGNLGRVTTIETGFGKAVLELLKQFGLPDADILAKHYKTNPRPDGKTWPELLSKYRGTVMHKGYFNFRTSDEQIIEVHRVLLHIHDIVLRIIFKMLGYSGSYLPTVSQYATPKEIDWVKVATLPKQLGYQ